MKKTIVSVMAHADDLEGTSGGTFAKYIADGYRGLIIVLSRCNSGWNGIPDRPEYISSLEIVPQRRAEAQAAAEVFGAELAMGDLLENNYTLRDGTRIVPSFTGAHLAFSEARHPAPEKLPQEDVPEGTTLNVAAGFGSFTTVHPEVQRVIDLLTEWEPELVLGQMIGNFNPDHLAAAQIAAMAWVRAAERVELGPLWLPVAPPDSTRELFPPFTANRWVDVTGMEQTALAALACHVCQGCASEASQNRLRRRWASFGAKHGVPSAEGFREIYPSRGPTE